MSFTSEEKEEIYRNTKTIHQDGRYLVIEPLSRDSIEYHGGSKIMVDYYGRKYRNGDIYLIIDKQSSPVEVLSVFIPENSNETEFIDFDGETFIDKEGFFDKILPKTIFDKVELLVNQNTTYGRLLRILGGEKLDFVDELISNIEYNETNPKKTILTISFDDEMDYFKTIGVSDDDKWVFNTLFSGYYYDNSLNLYDSHRGYDDFSEGYMFRSFSDENMKKLNEILKYISPENYDFKPEEEWGEKVGKKLTDLFGREVDNIIDEYSNLENDCLDDEVKQNIIDDFCDIYKTKGIFVNDCFVNYFTSIGLLIAVYNTIKDKTLSIGELMFKLAENTVDNNSYGDYIYETYCNEDYSETFNKEVSSQLDKILEELEDSDQFLDIKGFNELYSQAVSKYGINKYNVVPKDKNKKFRIITINPSINKIVIEVVNWDTNEFEKRELNIEEFNNFLYTGELF
jgi:hypothetical protein